MRTKVMTVLMAAALLAACGKSDKKQESTAPAAPAATAATGEKLPGTGLTQKEAEALLDTSHSTNNAAPEGCTWVVNETEMAGGDYLLYKAASCKGKTTKLEFSAGAHAAVFKYAVAAFDEANKDAEVLEMFAGDPGKSKETIMATVKSDEYGKSPACKLIDDKENSWAKDALVVQDDKAEAVGEGGSCGKYGHSGEGMQFWRIVQDYSFFFSFGQSMAEIDPGTITVVVQDEGKYRRFTP